MAAPHEQGEVIASRRGFFWVGVDERIETPVGHTNRGAMYVEWEAPETVTQPVPIILVHGGGGQGTDYLGTPDGRPGWWPQLVQDGWAVYAVDRPGHGRAPLHPDVLGPMGPPFSYEFASGLFAGGTTGPMAYPPGIEAHTQWPGSARIPTIPTTCSTSSWPAPARCSSTCARPTASSRTASRSCST